MRKERKYLMVFYLLSFLLIASCSDTDYVANEEGLLRMKVNVESNVSVTTRILPTQTDLADSAVIRIYSEKGLIRRYKGVKNVPGSISLKSGDYRVKVVSGDSVAASFDKLFYKGNSAFAIKIGQTSDVTIPCKIANTLVTVAYSGVQEAFKSYQVKVFLPKDTLVFDAQNLGQTGHFMLPDNQTPINWLFEGIQLNGSQYTKTGVIESPQPTTKYVLTFSFSETGLNSGGALVDVSIDKTEIRVEEEVVIFRRPDISGENINIASPVRFEVGKTMPLSIWIATSSRLKSAVIASESFSVAGLVDATIELVGLTQDKETELQTKGITILNKQNEQTGNTNFRVTFADSFVGMLTSQESEHFITVTAIDSNDKQRTETLHLIVSDAVVNTLPMQPYDVWHSKAVLRAVLLKETSESLSFEYRRKGELNWQSVPAQRLQNQLSATVTALDPNAIYEYRALAGVKASSSVFEFTTDETMQLPNNGFEFWSKPGKAWLIYGDGQSMFWDSGNHGSVTMNKNVTTYDTSIFHSGVNSIKLQSQFVGLGSIGKFAAGNVFSGKYLATEGTDGVLSFGRPFKSRPTKLRGYFKYNAGKINYTSLNFVPTNAMDTALIYIALGDWKSETYNGEQAPVLIKTKESQRQLFDPNHKDVIAYGAMQTGESSAGEGLLEFEINLDYRTLEVKPAYIVVVATASKYGDYFTGSTSSTLWLDDLELIYE